MVRRAVQLDPFMEPVEAATAGDLCYVSDTQAGMRRRRAGRGFAYLGLDGKPVRDQTTLARIRKLAIPPAWTDVWICRQPNGHLQATGRDARGRKQYRYHPRWREVRDETKYERMELFGSTLPGIRASLQEHLQLSGLPREKVLATLVRLLETTFIRVGNDEYVRANNSFGLTTLRNRHVQVQGPRLEFRFPGKSGKNHAVRISDRRLAALVRRIRELPGQDLFQYLDQEGQPQPISSADVNQYLREISGQDFTAKDFRTWAGTVLTARHLNDLPDYEAANLKSALGDAAKFVARQLGNTAAICRKCYMHPVLLDAYQNRAIYELWKTESVPDGTQPGLSEEESAVLQFLAAVREARSSSI
jgi:DNA topoisomerase-1